MLLYFTGCMLCIRVYDVYRTHARLQFYFHIPSSRQPTQHSHSHVLTPFQFLSLIPRFCSQS